jgi:cleavage and polyadenylation specificity factor subunit 3
MGRLRAALQSKFADSDIKVHTPRNCEPLDLTFNAERIVKVIGKLAAEPLKPTSALSGLLIQKDFSYTMLDPQDLKDFTGLGTSDIIQRQSVSISVGWEVVRWHLEGMYGEVEEAEENGMPMYKVRRCVFRRFRELQLTLVPKQVMDAVSIIHVAEQELRLEWVTTASNDMIADSALALLCGIDSNFATIKS